MFEAPKQDWAAYEALTQRLESERLRRLAPSERFRLYEDLYRLIAEGRRGRDWSRLDAWRREQKTTLRRQLVDAYRKLDDWCRERSAACDTD